jgi:5'-3' exonuclease
MIIYDIAGIFHSSVYSLQKLKEQINLENMRIRVLDHFVNVNKKMFPIYKREVVLACENKSWRFKEFPYYKIRRTLAKDRTGLDWKYIHEIMNTLLQEFQDYLPYKIISVKDAEGDDIIASLSQYIDREKVIISRDKDFKQLLDDKTKIFDPLLWKYLEIEGNRELFIFNHILKGDDGDDIPNIYSQSNFYSIENRNKQKSIFAKEVERLHKLTEQELEKELEQNFQRFLENRKLIDFRYIPEHIRNSVIEKYSEMETPRNNVYKYLETNKLTQFFSDITNL